MVTPFATAASSAARVRGVTFFSSLVRVPSKSSASTRIFFSLISSSLPGSVARPLMVVFLSYALLYNEALPQCNPPGRISLIFLFPAYYKAWFVPPYKPWFVIKNT